MLRLRDARTTMLTYFEQKEYQTFSGLPGLNA